MSVTATLSIFLNNTITSFETPGFSLGAGENSLIIDNCCAFAIKAKQQNIIENVILCNRFFIALKRLKLRLLFTVGFYAQYKRVMIFVLKKIQFFMFVGGK